MSAVEIMLERETANDESALVVQVLVPSGQAVKEDELLFEIENSKAVQELRAPSAGILTHALTVGQTVEFGVAIAHVGPAGEGTPPVAATSNGHGTAPAPAAPAVIAPAPMAFAPAAAAPAAVSGNGHGASGAAAFVPPPTLGRRSRRLAEPRISSAAKALAEAHGVQSSRFDVDFVTTRDVQALLGLVQQPASLSSTVAPLAAPLLASTPARSAPPLANGAQTKAGQLVSGRKRAEIDSLTRGAGGTMLSVLGVSLGALAIDREPGDFLTGRITDLVLYEASRLVRKFPKLNAYYNDGQVVLHEAVHAGLAIDDGGRLVVYGIENADRLGLPDLGETVADAVGRYLDNALTAAEMTRATFTVTDLSAEPLDFVLPLLPWGQSLILGITQSDGGFRVFAGFDHRVTEGREVALFLGELRARLLSFAAAQVAARPVPEGRCNYCDRAVSEVVAKGGEKGLLKVVGKDGGEVLCCASCWNGW